MGWQAQTLSRPSQARALIVELTPQLSRARCNSPSVICGSEQGEEAATRGLGRIPHASLTASTSAVYPWDNGKLHHRQQRQQRAATMPLETQVQDMTTASARCVWEPRNVRSKTEACLINMTEAHRDSHPWLSIPCFAWSHAHKRAQRKSGPSYCWIDHALPPERLAMDQGPGMIDDQAGFASVSQPHMVAGVSLDTFEGYLHGFQAPKKPRVFLADSAHTETNPDASPPRQVQPYTWQPFPSAS
ncbi:uncharacterized protein THITE_110219 [Thermothielavioides terrestris NRRL 8126]|uniref:Uncharacterized protein n=1 Tax=Thermothielavioides terrestris (strain ATCC 38088 / NRRL 8126) TaxID=578455 RepID=G2R4V4_THETT|nr:uncharacterized protein THITE_110219 [Thermothielavioides terrestris NRRL 8126]AEO66940.1 hypothetical protein THITE_110219 [Thermothielavioides terrestris NRRL 8126]